jgi:hypothetical protein
LQDIGVYCLNAARHIFAAEPIDAVAVKSFGNGSGVVGEVEESIAVTLRFPEAGLRSSLPASARTIRIFTTWAE